MSELIKMRILVCFLVLFLTSCVVSENDTSTLKPTAHNSATTSMSTSTTKAHSTKPLTVPVETSTTTTTTTTKPQPKRNCSAQITCGSCTDSRHCFWCGPTQKCFDFPSGKIIPSGCSGNKWYWGQCTIAGNILIIVVPSVGGFLLLLLGCCIYCKCCRQSNKSWKKEEERLTQRRKDRQLKADEKKSDRKKRSDELRMKYGLLKSDDEEPLI